MNLDQIGTQTANIKITSVEKRNTKTNWVGIEGVQKKLVAWADSKTRLPIQEGQEGEAVIETKDETNPNTGETYKISWLKSFGGQQARAGKPMAPKDESAIVAQVCLKGAIETAIHNAQHRAEAVDPNEVQALSLEYAQVWKLTYAVLKAEG